MNATRAITILFLLTTFCSTPVVAQGPVETQILMFNLLYEIEQANGLPHKASTAINELNEQGRQLLFDNISDKKKFAQAVNAALQRIQAAKTMPPELPSEIPSIAAQKMVSSTAYPPDYPSTSSAAYGFANALGLTSSPDQRCGGTGLENYRSVLVGAEEVYVAGDAVCTAAGCDPTGIGCAIACISVEALGYAVHIAKLPLDACEVHEGNVNAAEIEAGFENTVSLLRDVGALATDLDNHDNNLTSHDDNLASHDDNLTSHDDNLASHDDHLTSHDNNLSTHDGDIKGLLANVLGNQHEIIKLLKTPQGRRPGWNEEGYSKK